MCPLTVKRRMSLVEQELLSHPKHNSSLSAFSVVRAAQSWGFCVVFFFFFFRNIWLFHLAMTLSVLRFTAFDLVSSNFSYFKYCTHIICLPFIYEMAVVVKTTLRYALKHQQMTLLTIQTVTYLIMFIYILFYSLCLRKQYR